MLKLKKEGSTCDLVSEVAPQFSISPGNYYRTRDDRKAYVVCGPVAVSVDGREQENVFFGYTDDCDGYGPHWWEESGHVEQDGGEYDHDIVAPWHPETLTDPTTGKKYRVAEEVT